jgi:hypothetical protein
MGEKEISQYLSYPASGLTAAANTQSRALGGMAFLHEHMLPIECYAFGETERAKKREKFQGYDTYSSDVNPGRGRAWQGDSPRYPSESKLSEEAQIVAKKCEPPVREKENKLGGC